MLYLDKNDPLDRMLLQELNGEPVTLDVWMDALDELEEGPDCDQILQEYGLRREDVLREAKAYRAGFLARLSEHGLSIDDRFQLCANLFNQAKTNPSMELRRIYCEILCDPGFLLDRPYTCSDEEDQQFCEDLEILDYLDFGEERDHLLETLNSREKLSEKFSELTKKCATHGLWIAVKSGAMRLSNASWRYSTFPKKDAVTFCWGTCQIIFKLRRRHKCSNP